MKAPKSTDVSDTSIQEEEVATHQEAIPVPYFAGTRKIAVRWITPALDIVTQKAKNAAAKK